MKTVFNSNSQLANTFAAQNQIFGRSKSMFFEHETAYSYGKHYIAATFITADNGERICFVNSRSYSVTTAKHTQILWNAIPDGIKVFRVPMPRYFSYHQVSEVLKPMKEQAEKHLAKQLNARKSTFHFYQARNIIADIKEISELFFLTCPNTWDFKNFEAAREKVVTIQNQVN
jgi:hypothetical protein